MLLYDCGPYSAIYDGREVSSPMDIAISFLVSVAAGIVATYLCKWLDEHVFKDSKH